MLFAHNLISKAICSECTDFVYNCVFQKKEKQHSQNLLHFENESTFRKRTTFWKWKLIPKPNIENENMCLEKLKTPFKPLCKKTATLLGQSSHVIDWNQCIRDLDDDSLLCWVCNNSILVGSRTFNGVETEIVNTFRVAS